MKYNTKRTMNEYICKDDRTGLFYMANLDMGLSRKEKAREREKRRRNKKTTDNDGDNIHRIRSRRE